MPGWGAAGCVLVSSSGKQRAEPEPKPKPAADAFELTQEAGGEAQVHEGASASARHVWRAPAGSEYWLERYGAYMSAQERTAFLACPERRRFERFGARLLEYERREAMLAPYRDRLDPEEIAQYRRLEDTASARAWLRRRFGEE